ncbi:ITR [Mytilus edulis]|uniref:SLC2A13 n=1 Tax=Mytilus edulis TaxID=6550 RepID=A0A8S3UME0_MYTED|nr:ITR [Mytilus edulis]
MANIAQDKLKKMNLKSANNIQRKQSSCFLYTLSFFATIGGFLFGYDTGVVSGAMLLLKEEFALDSFTQEIIVSVTIAAAIVFALVSGYLNSVFGRKVTTLIGSIVFTGGAIILGIAQNTMMLIVGRGILGIGIGITSMTVPVYIAECAPAHMRGRLVALNNASITCGQFIASVIDGAFSYDKRNGWRYMLGIAGIPSAIQFVGFLFLPESPRWLLSKSKDDQARKILRRIRDTDDVEDEILDVKARFKEHEASDYQGGLLKRIFTTPSVRRALFLGCGIQLFQQLSGINTVMYYSASIIKMSGVRDNSTAIWMSAATSFVNFVFSLLGVWLVERIGRRLLALLSLVGILISLIVLAVGFQLSAFSSPSIAMHEQIAENSSCNYFSSCQSCIQTSDCGFCYIESGNTAVNGSCLPYKEPTYSSFGRCNSSSLPNDLVWADNFCPSSYSWMGLMGLVLYLMAFAPGLGPVPWTINSEIYPLWARSACSAMATSTNWFFNLLVSLTFLTLIENITAYGTYWLFAGIVTIALIFIFIALPETKGLKLEEVQQLFDQGSIMCGKSKNDINRSDEEIVVSTVDKIYSSTKL